MVWIMEYTEVALGLIGPVVVALGIIVSSRMIRKQMRLNYNLNIRNKSLQYSLYANEHLRDARIEVERVFGPMFAIAEAIPMAEIREKMNSNNGSTGENHVYASILTLLAHWENMALSIDVGLSDDDVCFEMVASTLIQHVKIFRNFIEERRSNNPRVYDHLMSLRRRWEDRLMKIQRSNFQPLLTGA